MSHDLRAPVRHIAGFTELLQKHADSVLNDKSRHDIRMILDSANRMGSLVDDLLDFSRIGRAETQKTTVNLEQLVKTLIGEIAPDTEKRKINWRIGHLPSCYGDPSMLRLVFGNLVSNAVKFTRTREQAEIEIDSLNHTPEEVVVFVKDNGVGFDMKYKDKLFGVFQRLHSQEAFEGTGIGLATVQRIVHRHSGRVWGEGAIDHGATIGHPVFGATGEMLALVGTHVDVTERKRAEALLSGEKRLLEMIATGIPLKQILNALCLIIEEQRSDTLASVLLMKADGVHLNVIAAPNLPNEWIQQMEKLPIGPCAGSCGTAAFRGSPVIVSDIATDPLWDVPQHRAAALHHGLQASWSNPVVSPSGKVLGTFCIYHREPHSPNEQDFELIELATHIARVAIERDRAEEALRTSEQLARSHVEVMMRSLDVLATEAAPEKFVAEMLRTIGQRLRASSVSLWLRNQQDESLRLQLVIENDQEIAPHSDHPFVKNPKASKGNPYFQEMFFTKGPVVCEDVAHDPRIGKDFREYLIKRGRKRFMAIPMFVLGEVRGFIGIQHVEGGTYRPEEIELAQALAHHVMMAAHGAELAEQRRHAVVLEERTRMARDIHDTLAQGFTGVIVQLEAAEDALGHGSRKEAEKHLQRAGAVARRSLSEARRSVHALRPQALWEHNFWDALKDTIKNTTVGTALHTTFEAQGKIPELPQSWQENLLRIG